MEWILRQIGQVNNRNHHIALLIISAFSLLSYGRVWLFQDVMWDDNCWIMSAYARETLEGFLGTGFKELRREPLGVFLYYLFGLHKTTDYYYVVWHTINMVTQILSPVFLYLFIANFFDRKQILAFFVAISFVVFPLDYTLLYASALNYRIGLLLSLVSFFLTERALSRGNVRYGPLLLSLLCAVISYYVFIEVTVTLEPARLFVIGYIFYRKGINGRALFKVSLKYMAPFIILSIPLILYKLIYKPYGIYAGIYETDPLFFLDWGKNATLLAHLLFFQWGTLLINIVYTNAASIVIGIVALVFSCYLLKRLPALIDRGITLSFNSAPSSLKEIWKNEWRVSREVFFLGIIFLIPAVLIFQYAGRPISWGIYSSHGAIAQIGYAIILGSVISFLYTAAYSTGTAHKWIRFLLVAVLGLGVFFNNVNLDLYFLSWEKQKQFWVSFTQRFPTLPDKAEFLFDVQINIPYSDLYYYYDYEFPLNLLYARSNRPEEFNNYAVFTAGELYFVRVMESRTRNVKQLLNGYIVRTTHLGKEVLNPRNFIVVYYRGDELLVNREILEKYPGTPYKAWLDKDFPELPNRPVSYPVRSRLKGFYLMAD